MIPTSIARHGISTLAVGLGFVLKLFTDHLVGAEEPLIFFVPAVTFSAWYGGLQPGLYATALSSFLCIFFFFHPTGSILMSDPSDAFGWLLFLVEGIFTSVLMEELHVSRRRAETSTRQSEELGNILRRSEERLQAILDNSTAVIYVKDVQGRYTLVNRRFEELFHVSNAQIAGKTDHDVFPGEIADLLQKNDREVLKLGKAIEFEEVVPQRGEQHTYVSLKFPLLDTPAQVHAIAGMSTDITPLKEAQRRALRSERLAAIGQMVAGLAHESRNALQRGQACLEMLLRRLHDRPESIDLVNEIQQALDDLNRLYEEVRQYAAPITLDRRACSLKEIVREAWVQLAPERQSRHARLIEPDDSCPKFEGDRFRLVQVYRNIMENSLSACPDPCEIEIDWSPAKIGDRPALRVAVRDNGPGLSGSQRTSLFEPFFTTKTQGTGLGLAIARRIIEAHDGLIAVGPEDGQGTTIVITLPLEGKVKT